MKTIRSLLALLCFASFSSLLAETKLGEEPQIHLHCWAIEAETVEGSVLEQFLYQTTKDGKTSELRNPGGKLEDWLKKLKAEPGIDILSAPSVLTLSGQEARIKVGREFIYPTSYAKPKEPDAFESKHLGVSIRLKPTLESDGTIQTIILAEFSEIDGSHVETRDDGTTIELPLFNEQEFHGTHRFQSGEFAVSGGLIREDIQTVQDGLFIFKKKRKETIERTLFFIIQAEIFER